MEQKAYEMILEVDVLLEEGYHMWEGFGLPFLSEEEKHGIVKYAVMICQRRYHSLAEGSDQANIGKLMAEKQEHIKYFAAACQCFYLFRKLHTGIERAPETATLLGDYFFSRFSHYLIPIDSVRLIELFSEYLKQEIQKEGKRGLESDRTKYLDFISQAAEEIQL